MSNLSEFKSWVVRTLEMSGMRFDVHNDIFFSQTLRGYYAEYKPNYPEETPADFIIYQDLNGSVSLYGNFGALVPTVDKFNDFNELQRYILKGVRE